MPTKNIPKLPFKSFVAKLHNLASDKKCVLAKNLIRGSQQRKELGSNGLGKDKHRA